MLGGQDAIHSLLTALEGEISVRLEHRRFGGDGFGRINLDLVILLRRAAHNQAQSQKEYRPQGTCDHGIRITDQCCRLPNRRSAGLSTRWREYPASRRTR